MTTPTPHGQVPEALRSIQRFEVVDRIDDKHVPAVIPKPHGPWVRYEDHVTALKAAQPAAQQPGAAYAALSDVDSLAQEIRRVDGAHRLGAGALAEALMPFLRASHGQAPAQAAPAAVAGPSDDETQKLPGIVDKALNELAGFVKFLETANGSWDSRTAKNALRDIEWFARRKLAAAPQPSPTAQAADSVQEDAARLDFLIEQRAYVVSDPDACPGYWLHFVHKETGKCWVQGDEHPTPRAAIDAARAAQGGK